MKAILLIGGLGTRLRPFTLTTPKPLLPILNEPFLAYQIRHLAHHGIADIILCTAYNPQAFHKVLSDGRALGVRISYAHEKTPLGTGGAIKNAERFIEGCTLVCNGDILMDLNIGRLLRFHRQKKALATVALTRVKNPTAYGLIETDSRGRIHRFVEKPSWKQVTCNTVNAGAYVFEPSVFSFIPEGKPYSVERQLFPKLLKLQKPLYGKVVAGYWIDIGTVEKYRQTQADILQGVFCPARSLNKNPSPLVGDHTVIHPHAKIEGPTVIGRNCRIGKGALIKESILMDHVTIGEGVHLEKSVIGSHTTIEPNAVVGPGTAIGDFSRITSYSQL